jgi:hypothetical protein
MTTFVFDANWYRGTLEYGLFHVAYVDVLVSLTKLGYYREKVLVKVPTLLPGCMVNIYYYSKDDPISRLYSKWDNQLGRTLTRHLIDIADDLLNQLEVELQHQKRKMVCG